MASWERRLGAYLIDLIPLFVVGFALGSMPTTTSWIAAGYMLLRDVGGASPGKLVLGLRVEARDGGPSSLPRRVLRNVVLALQGISAALLPFAGMGGLALLARLGPTALILVDGIYLVQKGERLSDRIVGTRVAVRSTQETRQ
jgi:uncharacterized RDD family membrane protein YckC